MAGPRRRRPLPGLELRARRHRGGPRRSAARPSCCGTATPTVGGVDAVVVPGRVRPRRLPAARRHRPVLAGDGRGRRRSPPTAARSSASATASRCSPRPGCCPARCRRTAGLKFLCTTVDAAGRDHRLGAHLRGRGRRRAAHPDQPLRGQLHLRRPRRSAELRAEDRIVLRYVDNPNGSVDDIAGICNEGRNVVGPHAAPGAGLPRRCSAPPTAPCCCGRCWCSAGRRERPTDRAAQLAAADAGLLQHARRPRRAARQARVGDALAVAVALGRLDEVGLEAARSTLAPMRLELGGEVEPLLDELQRA